MFALPALSRHSNDRESGRKQIQAKIMLQFQATDKICAERVISVWKTMLGTTRQHKSTAFACLDDYLEFRIVDCGAP